MEKGERRVLHFDLTSEQLAEGGLICGGNIDIFLEPLREEFFNYLSGSGKDKTERGISHPGYPDLSGWCFSQRRRFKGIDEDLWREGWFFIGWSGIGEEDFERRRDIVKRKKTKSNGFKF